MYTLIFSSDSPPGDGRTVPRTVSRTALREDLRNSNGHPDSPSGGTLEQPLRALRSKLRPLYRVAHIRCHLSGRASPSRTSSHRNPDSLSALRNYFVGGRENARSCMACVWEQGMCVEGCPSISIYRPRQGVGWWRKYQTTHATCPTWKGKKVTQGGHQGDTPMAAQHLVPPMGGAPPTSHQHVSMKHACSLDKKPPNMQPPIRGILSPRTGTRCFPRNFFLKNSRRSQNISGTL